jgi:hypothetical protein
MKLVPYQGAGDFLDMKARVSRRNALAAQPV